MEGLGVTPSFWYGRRVLVTGHTGFKGGWLALWLGSLQAQVTGLALAPEAPSLFASARIGNDLTSVIGDIRDPGLVGRVVRDAQPEIVFHLAAQPLVRASYRDPVTNFATNVLGTVHVLEAVRLTPGVRAVVVVTSDKCYENLELDRGYREEDRLGGHDPYSSSKACQEIVSVAYRRSFFRLDGGVALATARAGNVIGGGDWSEDRLIPDLVRAIEKGFDPVIRNPASVRPWQHVLEPLRGYLLLAERLAGDDSQQFQDAWNFGPADEDSRDVGWIVERFRELWGLPGQWTQDASTQPHETKLLRLDASKARDALHWHCAMDVEQALAGTVAWYRSQIAGNDMRAFSLEQIRAYGEMIRGVRRKFADEFA